MSSLDYLELCRLCLVKENVELPIFEDDGEARQIFFKISACLPVKVARDDKLPKKICDQCGYKVELLYQFWNTTVNAEKQLLQWLGEVGGLEDKQGYITEVLDSNVMKQERGSDSRLDGSVMQVAESSNIDINMIDNMSIITMPDGSEQQFTTVPIEGSTTVQVVAGSSTQEQANVGEEEEEEEEDNFDDGCDNDDGMTVKEETEDDQNERSLESTFVNVSMPCDEAGPSGLQQKITNMSEITPQTADGDSKPGVTVKPPAVIKLKRELGEGLDSLKQSAFEDPALRGIEEFEPSLELEVEGKVERAELIEEAELTEDNAELVEAPAEDVDQSTTVEPIRSLLVRMESGVIRRLYQCSQCEQMFTSVKQCVRHMTIGHPDSRKYKVAYRCKTCQKLFKTKYSCENHIQAKHKERKFSCRFCEFATSSFNYIKTHERNHMNDFDFKCDDCGKSFANKTLLERHVVSHTKIKPYICEVCGSRYADKRSLGLHALLHKPEGRPSKYTCDVCEYSSFWKNAVKTHMKIHTGAKVICDECGQAVSSNYYLKVHKRIHRDEKPFACNVCQKAFRQQKNLAVHQRTHTKVKPYHCGGCDKSFSQNVWLKKHKCNGTAA